MLTHMNYRYKFGTTRNVFLIWKYAIKIPNIFDFEWRLFLLGLLANMQEVSFSKMNNPKFCPIIFSLPMGFLVIMKRAEQMTDKDFETKINYLSEWIKEDNFEIPCELKSTSFGYLDDKIVVFDYGN